ncbi:TrmH family RNA methyltransferase [Selenomonas sputigena]|uniref:TrmH family RNA methyltransferase n=1 Tax=Selenomonas sputigena TaxID=69823 RepID=UPI002234AE11|nr:RNA methyltransferase [Selenomonas sputigena]UZE45915.1 RNA methyltransferase [Selenomonas sputigena]
MKVDVRAYNIYNFRGGTMEKIESAQNKRIKWIASLKNARRRREEGVVVAEGVRLVEMAAEAGWTTRFCLVTAEAAREERAERILARLASLGCPLAEVTPEVYKKASDTDAPQGILLVLEERGASLAALAMRQEMHVVVLDGVQDPGNAGTIVRTADAAGAEAVVCLEDTIDVFSAKAVRASMGSVFHVPVVRNVSRTALCEFLQQGRVRLLAADLDEAAQPYYAADYSGRIALAFGNEGNGVSDEVRRMAEAKLFIPMFGKAESLNVATAAALVLYEAAGVRRGFRRHCQ